MFSFQMGEEVRDLLRAFKEANYFFETLDTINSSFPKMEDYLGDIGQGGQKASNASHRLLGDLGNLKNKLASIDPRIFYSSMEQLQKELLLYSESALNHFDAINDISNRINSFSSKYGMFLKQSSPVSAAHVVVEARNLSSTLEGFRSALLLIARDPSEEEVEAIYEDEQSKLSLLLTSPMSVEEFGAKLISLSKIYKETCDLLEVSTSQYPLVIEKIESGSLWAEVLGNEKVINLMAAFLGSAATYIYKSYTKEGKLSAIPQKVESLDSVLDLALKLEKAGVKTTEVKDSINKASVTLSKQINILLDRELEVVINNKSYNLGSEVHKELLESGKTLKLEHNDDERK